MKPWVLLVGTSFSAAPILFALKRRGFQVAVCGSIRSDPCVAYADAYHEFDYSNRDALLQLVKTHDYRWLCPSCNDYAYLSAAHVAEQLGRPGFDSPFATRVIHNKSEFRKYSKFIGIPTPEAYRFTADNRSIISGMTFPLLVKPGDSSSGRGMRLIERVEELDEAAEWARSASRSADVVVEELIPGTLHSHSAFLVAGSIATDYFVDEFCQTYPYQVDCSNSPSRLGEAPREQIRANILQLVKPLGLADGLIHTQFISGAKGTYIIECMRRCPGDLYFHLIDFSTGAHYLDNYVAPFVGQPIARPVSTVEHYWARHTVSFASDQIFCSLSPMLPDAEEVRMFPLAESASLVRQAPYGKAAILFAKMSDKESLFDLTPRIAQYVHADRKERTHD